MLTPCPNRLVVIDTLGELSQLQLVQGVNADELRQIMLTQEKYRIGIIPQGEDQFEYVCEAVAARRDITLAIDEMDSWFPTSTHLPPQPLMNLSMCGGHYDQDLYCITHRPSAIHKSILSQSTLWIFPMFDDVDVKKVKELTRRINCPSGVDPRDIQPLEVDANGWTHVSEVARVSPLKVQICRFDLRSGKLYSDD